MRPGLAEYDLASLLYDPYVSLHESERAELIQFYQTTAEATKPAFGEKLHLCIMQRLMQALGAYGYLGLVKGNKAFLAHTPAALVTLGQVLATTPGLGTLHRLVCQLPRQVS